MFTLDIPVTTCPTVDDSLETINSGIKLLSIIINQKYLDLNKSFTVQIYQNTTQQFSPVFIYQKNNDYIKKYTNISTVLYVPALDKDINTKIIKKGCVLQIKWNNEQEKELYNVFVEKDIYSQETSTSVTINNDTLKDLANILDSENRVQVGSIILEAVYNEYYPSLLKLGDDVVSRYKNISVEGLPTFLFYDDENHRISGSIHTTNNIQFIIILDNIVYINVVIKVSVREII